MVHFTATLYTFKLRAICDTDSPHTFSSSRPACRMASGPRMVTGGMPATAPFEATVRENGRYC